ncbi:uncharacterized protein LOC115065772 [Bactrocera dorsalis]|uniref:Uncharacterized protein LOC115065772 n=1 Tax=Bactrocera dorsalis TaxID=27457 RepID=A0A8N4QE13_BACDO|nr:uncharacterized protein LOC115065772 [Bactrocera dorsalis]
MVLSKHFMICILLALLKKAACENSVDYSNNVINATTRRPTHIPSTSNFTVTISSLSSIFPDTDEKNEIETTTKLDKKIRKIINNSLNSTDNLNSKSRHTTKAEIDITLTTNADKNSENIGIAKKSTSNRNIFDNLNNAETTLTTISDEITTNSTQKITKNSTTTTKFRVECDIEMNNGDPKSVRTDICGCAEGYEILEYDEFQNKINKTCVEVLPETTTKNEEMKTMVSSEEQKEIKTPLLYSNDNRNNSLSKIHVTTQADVNNHNTRFAVMATTSVGPPDNRLDDSNATTKPAMPNIATTLSAEDRLRNISDHSTESNTLAYQKVSYEQVITSSRRYITLLSLTRRKEKLRTNGSQMTYYIIGSALVASISIASGILFLRNLRRTSYYEI